MTAQILLHPQYWRDSLRADALRTALADALATEAEHYVHIGPELAARYWRHFGDLELAWQRRRQPRQSVPAQSRHLDAARQRLALPAYSRAGTLALRADYRRLVQLLHPQLHPQQSAAHAARWAAVQAAFQAGDARGLRIALREQPAADGQAWVDRAEYNRLHTSLRDTRVRLAALRQRFPFNQQAMLDDPARLAAQRAAMCAQIQHGHNPECVTLRAQTLPADAADARDTAHAG